MKINELKSTKTSSKKNKRRGRGSGSGLGKTSGRGVKGQKSRIYRRLPKRGFNNPFKVKIQNINFNMINIIVKKYNLDPNVIKEEDLFDKKIFKKSKGSLKLLNVGELEKTTNLEISYASKKAIEALEKLGGKIKLTKK